jgi:hypothetical protein
VKRLEVFTGTAVSPLSSKRGERKPMTFTTTLTAGITLFGDRLDSYTATLVDLDSLDPLGSTEPLLLAAS